MTPSNAGHFRLLLLIRQRVQKEGLVAGNLGGMAANIYGDWPRGRQRDGQGGVELVGEAKSVHKMPSMVGNQLCKEGRDNKRANSKGIALLTSKCHNICSLAEDFLLIYFCIYPYLKDGEIHSR